METTNAKPAPDWEKIEADYRAGIKTLRQIAGEHGVSHVAINKRAKRDGWSRDLSAKIAAKADELVTKGAVTSAVTTESRISEREIIDANAQAIVSVRLSHRRDIQRSRRIAMALLEELEQQAGGEQVAMLEQLGELLRSEDDKGQDKLNDLYRKIISLPGRAKTMKDLGESLRVLVTLERQAFGLDDKDSKPQDALTTLLQSIAGANASGFRPVAHDPEAVQESGFRPQAGDDDRDD
ncbi:hypothetical protein [Aquabacterium sp.]|uniref:hypothetical protein n=1 Tax=Aquabacterium sp. TaxID=1872578 RepID=UPI002639992F|nr:hypothetical protein [Aquabacterium sp.]MDD2978137.1 hypothetical protein [Aquabacterium sp.]